MALQIETFTMFQEPTEQVEWTCGRFYAVRNEAPSAAGVMDTAGDFFGPLALNKDTS